MKISVKCPNCFQEVPEGNRFCIHCGYDLSGDAADSSAAKASVPVPTEAGRGAAAAFFTGPRFCPKGHDVPDPSLGFCPVCGLPLVIAIF